MLGRKLIVTHHAPDLDAITSTWLLKRFDSQHYADAKIAFVNPGDKITSEEANNFQCLPHEAVHVDTGMGEFDHHQPEQAKPNVCAASLVYEYLQGVHPELENDLALEKIVEYTTEIDHFQEIFWPDSDHYRYLFGIQELIRGHEFTDPHNDDSQMHFGMQCLDNAYAILTQHFKALIIIEEKGMSFDINLKSGKTEKGLALQTRNDDTIKLAQKQGYNLVMRKDPKEGNVRIKARPDSEINLDALNEEILKIDKKGTWFNHASGKMLLNGSIKKRNQKPTSLEIEQIVDLIKEIYE